MVTQKKSFDSVVGLFFRFYNSETTQLRNSFCFCFGFTFWFNLAGCCCFAHPWFFTNLGKLYSQDRILDREKSPSSYLSLALKIVKYIYETLTIHENLSISCCNVPHDIWYFANNFFFFWISGSSRPEALYLPEAGPTPG